MFTTASVGVILTTFRRERNPSQALNDWLRLVVSPGGKLRWKPQSFGAKPNQYLSDVDGMCAAKCGGAGIAVTCNPAPLYTGLMVSNCCEQSEDGAMSTAALVRVRH